MNNPTIYYELGNIHRRELEAEAVAYRRANTWETSISTMLMAKIVYAI